MVDAALRAPQAPSSATEPGAAPFLLQLEGITKRFPGGVALDRVDFTVRRGEVHVLFGENGAGKSTLINIVAGTYSADQGEMTLEGRRISHLNPHQARLAGISPVFQEFSLAPDLTVEENLFLGREHVRWGVLRKREMRAKARAVLRDLGFDLRADSRVVDLMRAQQQMTEIAKALLQDVKLLILDEPTASLTERETEKLFALIERLKRDDVGIIYVSHRIGEIRRVGDRVTVLRDGRRIETVEAAATTETQLVEMMTGRSIDVLFPHIAHRPGEVLFEARNLSTADGRLDDASFHVRAGEIVGVAGLVGCGKSEIARAAFGLERLLTGEILLRGARVRRPTPSGLLRAGLCYFPSDRAVEGLALPRPIRENVSVAGLDLARFTRWRFIRRHRERAEVRGITRRLRVRPPDIERPVDQLSGGNRQKVMLARGLTREIEVFLFDEPTVGIDVGAKTEIYGLLKELAESGAGLLLISSELPEVLNLSHRVYVMHRGRMVAELCGEEITEEAVLSSFFHGEEATPGAAARA